MAKANYVPKVYFVFRNELRYSQFVMHYAKLIAKGQSDLSDVPSFIPRHHYITQGNWLHYSFFLFFTVV